ncbi:MAG: lytic transglycosylase domain-containing protein [Thermodesulfobacteriota bacterium]|nr:lytic transglycosylase domain-containing protein [Thermodesulfobacteriota bacterium]
MIGKIDPRIPSGLPASAPSAPSGSAPHPDFGSIFRASIAGQTREQPLDIVIIQALSRALQAILSENVSEENGSLPSSLFPLNFPDLSPQANRAEYRPKGGELDAGVSNNLQGGQDIEHIVSEASRKYGVEPALIKSVIAVESNGDPQAVSPAGARGLMQLMPATAAELGVTDPFDPAQNVMAGTRYLRQLMDRYQGDVKLALAAYNWGMGNLEKRPEALPKETREYIARVESRYRGYVA